MTDHPELASVAGVLGPEVDADHTLRVSWSYLLGVYVAINAVEDLYLLVEGPDCIHMKTQFVQGNHDWLSTLTSVSGFHRVANTALHPVHMAASREAPVRESLMRMAVHPATGGLVLGSMPMAFITGLDYEGVCREVQDATGKEVFHVPGKSLSGDWLDGYGETLLAMARRIELDGGSPHPDRVAIVGHLFDRNEGDQRSNVRDLRGLFSAMGLDVTSVWLEGRRFQDLKGVKDAGTILSFPYGRKAARWLARRTGARLLECELPFGPLATSRLLRQVGAALGREQQAEAVIHGELARIAPSLEWVVPYLFQGRRIGFVGDPWLARGVGETARLLGAHLSWAAVTNRPAHCKGLAEELGEATRLLCWPRYRQIRRFMHDMPDSFRADVIVTNTFGLGILDAPAIEFGCPSLYTHALYDRPFLGFQGFLAFTDSLMNALRRHEIAGSDEGSRPRLGH
jgi:nitrogenase molybdenum-iron protein alpha/beta subunit